ncbi:MAG: DUF4124 domain-containing protein [Betaproteobacteria bacterium]|nr:DUF4124 domain-containing protein [Betaproteobacteria bacterium]
MNIGVITVSFTPRLALLAVLAIAAAPAWAQVYKCKSADGSPVFQESPCGSSTGISTTPQPPAGAVRKGEQAKPADSTNKAMNDAFQSRMDKKDYDGALAFATTDKQKELARKKSAEKNTKCETLAAKAKQAQADLQNKGEKWKSKADAANAEYTNYCR